MHDTDLGRATELFKAAGHPARLRILAMLRGGGLCVCQVTAVLELAVSTVSAHLAELRRAGLVLERKAGRWVAYGLTEDTRAQALLREVWTRVGHDPQLEADGRLVRGLRRIPVEDLCRAGLDVTRRRLRRAAAPGDHHRLGVRSPRGLRGDRAVQPSINANRTGESA